jgi:hypothetical protein
MLRIVPDGATELSPLAPSSLGAGASLISPLRARNFLLFIILNRDRAVAPTSGGGEEHNHHRRSERLLAMSLTLTANLTFDELLPFLGVAAPRFVSLCSLEAGVYLISVATRANLTFDEFLTA